jgi:succinate-semialdehyde dehydrogenase/glutarate-semialdehyde dehydrogenase
MHSINPATEELIKHYTPYSVAHSAALVEEVHSTHLLWKKKHFDERSRVLTRIADILITRKQSYATLISSEMGKRLPEAVAEIEKCAFVCRYYAEHAHQHLKDQPIELDQGKSLVIFEPLGVILAIMPWNFPFWQAFRFVAPALMAGNTIILKHASSVSGCALAIEQLVLEAFQESPLLRTLLLKGSDINPIIEHPLIRAVTFTGSNEAGKKVARAAGGALKKTVLELGGSDPYIILEDIDLEKVVQICANSRLLNTGQSCVAAKRFIVVESHYEQFVSKISELFKAITLGDPMDSSTGMGPMASIELRDSLHKQVVASIAKGAKCITGGIVPNRKGAFYPPTVLVNIPKDSPAYHEELFGPVATIISVRNQMFEHWSIRVSTFG